MIDTDKYECPHCKTEYDEKDVWHDIIDLQLWKTTSICDGCFEEDGGGRYLNDADIESLITERKEWQEGLIADAPLLLAEVQRLRKEINQLPIDLHESLDMILEAHYPEVRESVMSMFGDAWGNNLTGYEE